MVMSRPVVEAGEIVGYSQAPDRWPSGTEQDIHGIDDRGFASTVGTHDRRQRSEWNFQFLQGPEVHATDSRKHVASHIGSEEKLLEEASRRDTTGRRSPVRDDAFALSPMRSKSWRESVKNPWRACRNRVVANFAMS
jgi:hypothetical protein